MIAALALVFLTSLAAFLGVCKRAKADQTTPMPPRMTPPPAPRLVTREPAYVPEANLRTYIAHARKRGEFVVLSAPVPGGYSILLGSRR